MTNFCIKSLVAICLLGFSAIGIAQMSALVPSPLSIALTVGQWLMKDSKRVYYIQVESTAPTEEEARQAGFKLAITQAVGTLVVSETEVKNKEVARDEIIQYSSGYIEDFKTVSNTQVGNMTRLTMDVWVVESKIANRLLGESKADGTVDGARAAQQHQTYLYEQYTGDELINLVTRDFPKHAFDVKIRKTEIIREGRSSFINIHLKLEWSEAYITSLAEVLKKTRQNNGIDTFFSRNNWGTVVKLNPKSYWGFNELISAYADEAKGTILYNNLITKKPQIKLTLRSDHNQVVHSTCHDHQSLWGVYQNGGSLGGDQFFASGAPNAGILISGNYSISTVIKLSAGENIEALSRIKNVEVEIVPQSQCSK